MHMVAITIPKPSELEVAQDRKCVSLQPIICIGKVFWRFYKQETFSVTFIVKDIIYTAKYHNIIPQSNLTSLPK